MTLQADTAEGLVAWLEDNAYDVPPGFDIAIAPYLAAGQYVLALKLLKDRDTGDLQPISMTYTGDVASIPIQLTAVAASPGMPLEVYVFAEHRAVPISYLHVVPNPFAFDWFAGSVDWQDTIGRAADEAGGHAFATDFSGATSALTGSIYTGAYDTTLLVLPDDTTPSAWWQRIVDVFPPTAALLEVFRRQLPVPDGVDEAAYYNCVVCYEALAAELPFDSVAATADLEASIVQPLRDAEALFVAHPHLTRLTSSLDAAEMTVDPTFAVNGTMQQEVGQYHDATLSYDCAGQYASQVPRTFTVLPEGWTVTIPSAEELAVQQITEYEYLSSLATYAALRVERTTTEGEPEVVTDRTEWLLSQLAGPGGGGGTVEEAPASGCGCRSVNGGIVSLSWCLLGVIAWRRRGAARAEAL